MVEPGRYKGREEERSGVFTLVIIVQRRDKAIRSFRA